MKNLLKIFLISISLYACKNNAGGDKATNRETDDTRDSSTQQIPAGNETNNNKSSNYPDPSDLQKETVRQITSNLLASKQEISLLRSEISDSLSQPGLTDANDVILRKTILQLEKSSSLINKQLEDILASDLKNNCEKLNGIVKKMKGSEKDLGAMITRLDKITGYMQMASSLIQSLIPLPSTTVPLKTSK